MTDGEILFDGENIIELAPHERARLGLFLAFQYPVAIPGVSVANFLRLAINAQREEPIKVKEFRAQLAHAVRAARRRPDAFTSRHLNDGFSGGEKKRAEVLQMAMLRPQIAVLDETDSGLDIDALRTVAEGVAKLHAEQGLGALIITHYQRILDYVRPEFVHVHDGRARSCMNGGERARRAARARGLRPDPRGGRRPCLSATPEPPKPGAAREATLNHALGGRQRRRRTAAACCANARAAAYDALELPRWRRSGFWQTSFEELDLDALGAAHARARPDAAGDPRRPAPAPACSSSATPRSCTSSSTRSWRSAA